MVSDYFNLGNHWNTECAQGVARVNKRVIEHPLTLM